MSQTVRRQLIEISNTLRDANDLLGKLFQGVADEEMMELLTDCQNCAITMGNKIEAVYGSGLKSIHALENYCESIYQISQHLDSLSECMEIYEHSKEQLLEVQREIEEIPDKKEIVFMPYKASMWDSLESVYLAAREDENCETYVIPIPYFDRKADKTLGEMHYEGEEYPANIPITNWEKYNFEERQPDVIYIHNAYDDSNLVTCVHPRFFSGNLKKYTEKLVYIPYFVLEEIDPNDQVKIDAMKHFCFLPGIVNADRVILQSENMRQIYMNEYAKVVEAARGTIDRKQLEEKFLGTGSPKFDKIMNTKKEDLDIPEEWLHIIKKPDGSWKKIIFYNTSVTALLQYNEKMLDKMRYVFNVFKQHQNEVALLWRPHPLIKTTIESMRPQLWVEYSKIVEQYQKEGWGIYDDSSDVDRAVILCDAYYGDQSSVVQLVRKKDKPVMIQDVELSESYHHLGYMCGIFWKPDGFFHFQGEMNAFIWTNIISGQVEEIRSVPGENMNVCGLYYGISYSHDKLFLTPGSAREIAIWDMKTNIFRKKSLQHDIGNIRKMVCSYVIDNEVWFVPNAYPAIVCIDGVTEKITEYSQWYVEYLERTHNRSGRVSFSSICVNKSIWIASWDTSLLFEFETENKLYHFYEIENGTGGISTICYDGYNFWLSYKDGNIIAWNREEYIVYQLEAKYKCLNSKLARTYFYSFYFDNNIYFIPYTSMKAIKINIYTHEMESVHWTVKNNIIDFDGLSMVEWKDSYHLVLAYGYNKNNKFYIVDLHTGKADIMVLNTNSSQFSIDMYYEHGCIREISYGWKCLENFICPRR